MRGPAARTPHAQDNQVPHSVTRVKARLPIADPIPRWTWRDRLKHLARAMLVCVAIMLASAAVVTALATKGVV
jgi:hypothetical protein